MTLNTSLWRKRWRVRDSVLAKERGLQFVRPTTRSSGLAKMRKRASRPKTRGRLCAGTVVTGPRLLVGAGRCRWLIIVWESSALDQLVVGLSRVWATTKTATAKTK